jgi:BirA family transcriptional regulator, biotin operon repressor / biotin---[acetyl-CoA-carboxylase] ligase
MGDEPANRIGWRLRRFATIDSTNRWVLDQARHGAAAGLVAVADEQTEGRGRRGRTWSAPPGSSLLVSVLLRPTLHVEEVHVLTMAAALALRDAVEDVAGLRSGLKWPNDLVVGDRKLAGLLAEADLESEGQVRAVVIGLGCNIEWAEIPTELEGIATACNLEVGHPVDRGRVLDAFLDHLSLRLGHLDRVHAEYRDGLATLGRKVRVDLGDREVIGTATDVDAAGRLVVTQDAGAAVTVAVGDVVHLRDDS